MGITRKLPGHGAVPHDLGPQLSGASPGGFPGAASSAQLQADVTRRHLSWALPGAGSDPFVPGGALPVEIEGCTGWESAAELLQNKTHLQRGRGLGWVACGTGGGTGCASQRMVCVGEPAWASYSLAWDVQNRAGGVNRAEHQRASAPGASALRSERGF